MIELNTEEGAKLEIYDTSCILQMSELYGGLKGEYTELKLYGLSCNTVVVVETKRQIERMLKLEREQAKDNENYTNRMYRYTKKLVYKDGRVRDLKWTEYVIVTATKGGKVTAIDQHGKVERETKLAGKTVELKEEFFIKSAGMGRYWND